MGGVATYVEESDTDNVLKVSEGKESNEYIVTRHSQFSTPINIINVYGSQECRVSKETIKNQWDEIMMEVKRI